MNTVTIVLLIILVVLIGALIALYFFGKRAQRRQEEQRAQIQASKQTISMLVIDKKRLPIKQSGLPQMVIDQTPRLMRRTRLPIVKAKIGPRIQVMIADENVFDLIPLKKEIKAEVSGLYIVGVKGIRGNLEAAPKKKKGIFGRLRARAQDTIDQNAGAKQKGSGKKGAKAAASASTATKARTSSASGNQGAGRSSYGKGKKKGA